MNNTVHFVDKNKITAYTTDKKCGRETDCLMMRNHTKLKVHCIHVNFFVLILVNLLLFTVEMISIA